MTLGSTPPAAGPEQSTAFSDTASINLLQNLQTAVLLLARDLSIIFMNEAAESLFQTSLSRVTGEPFASLIYLDAANPADTPLMTELETALADNQPYTQREAALEVFGVGALTADYYATPMITDNSSKNADHLLLEFLPIDRKLSIGLEEERFSSQETTRMLNSPIHSLRNTPR